MTTPRVLIIGGGAVGALLACDLLSQSVPVRVVDARASLTESDPHSRAVMIWPRVLELLRKVDLADRLVDRGHPVKDVSFFSSGRHLGAVRLDRMGAAYPFGLGIVQRELEELLWARVNELGGEVEVGVRLAELDVSGPRPLARMLHADGSIEEARPDWLIGADGAGSTVREALGIDYPGVPFPLGIALGDFPITGPIRSGVEYHYSAHGMLPLVHLPGRVARLATVVLPGEQDWSDRPRADWQTMVNERTNRPYTLGEPLWKRTYYPRPGVAERFRRGRVVLVGDAAHSVVPLGGQGLNLGLQDAFALGWRLSGVLRAELGEGVLDDYDTERRLAVEQVRTLIRAEMSLSAVDTPAQRRRRDAGIRLAHRTGVLRRVIAPLMSQIGLSYAPHKGRLWTSSLRIKARPGDRLPIFHGHGPRELAPVLDGGAHVALMWPGARAGDTWLRHVSTAENTLKGRVARVHDLAGLRGANRRRFTRLFGLRPTVALVRPDGHLAYSAPADQPDLAAAYLPNQTGR